MEPEIKNFSEIERFIKERPKEADALAFKWQGFVKQNPEALSFRTAEEFHAWLAQHPKTDPDIWLGKEIQDAYFYLRSQHEDSQMQTQGIVDPSTPPVNLAILALPVLALAFRDRPKIIEDDKDYQKIAEEQKKLWLGKNPGKDFTSKEGLDYLYGSLDDESAPTLKKDAGQAFRDNPRYRKRIERYDKESKKIYKNIDDDPRVIRTRKEIAAHIKARQGYLKTHEEDKKPEDISRLIQKQSWERFVEKHPEKTKKYGQSNIDIKKAYEKEEIKKQLADLEQKTGRQIRYVEKTHRPQGISAEEAARRLESITPQLQEEDKEEKKYKQPPQPTPREFFGNVRTRISNIGRESYRVGKRLTTQEGRTIGRFAGRTGLNIARQGTRLTIQGGRAAIAGIRTTIQAAMMLSRVVVAGIAAIGPVGWIVIAVIIVIIVIVFFFIMLLGGGGGCASSLYSRVFVTSTRSNGDLVTYVKNNIDGTFTGDGLQAGDKICQWRADNATPNPLGGTWTAWLSTDAVDTKDRIVDQTYVRTECDKVVVADSKADLINGDIDNAIAKDENSNTLRDVGVWTGTKEHGERIANDNCSGWTVGDSSRGGMTGDSGSTTYIWTSFFSSRCDDSNNHLYCFEQGTISPTPTPT